MTPPQLSDAAVGIILVGLVACVIVWYVCEMIKTQKKFEKWHTAYTERKKAFYFKMSERQKSLNRDMQGASDVEKFMVLEARIHELEQIIRNQQDDGK